MLIPDKEELAWAAGFFEGEGCFTRSIQTRGNSTAYNLKAHISQTTEEPIIKFYEAIGFGRINGPYQNGKYKEYWRYEAAGYERVQELLVMLWPHLSDRRKEEGTKIILGYREFEKTRVRFNNSEARVRFNRARTN